MPARTLNGRRSKLYVQSQDIDVKWNVIPFILLYMYTFLLCGK